MPRKCQLVMPSMFYEPFRVPNRDQAVVVALVILLHFCLLFIGWPQIRQARTLPHDLVVSVSMQPPTTLLPEIPLPVRTVAMSPRKVAAEAPAVSKSVQPEPAFSPESVADISPPAALIPSVPVIVDSEPDYRAIYLRNPPPIYPMQARRMGWKGKVILNVEVLADGRCGGIGVFQSSGHRVLDDAALSAVRQWRFLPATHAGVAVTRWFKIPINFSLEG